MLIWTARVSKKTKAVVAVILAGILAAAVLLLVGRSGGGQDAAAWQLTGNADRIAYLESMGWQVEEEPVETLQFLLPEKLGGALPHLQRAAGFPGLRPFCVLRQASGPVHLHRHQLSRTAGGCPGQPLRLRGAAGGRGYPLRRGRRIPGHTGLSGAGLSPFGMACGQKKNCRIAAVLFLG